MFSEKKGKRFFLTAHKSTKYVVEQTLILYNVTMFLQSVSIKSSFQSSLKIFRSMGLRGSEAFRVGYSRDGYKLSAFRAQKP